MDNNSRSQRIIRYNLIGIIMNCGLAITKMIVGSVTHAQAIFLDGVNSFADMLSSLISVFTTFIGKKSSDKSHPFGYGRIEYLSSLAVTMLIMFIGLTTIIDSVKSLFHPGEPPEYNLVSIIIVCISMGVKFTYGVVMRINGRKLHSGAMMMTGMDSMGDGMVSFSILIAIIIYKATGVDIQNYLCIGIALMIIYSGCSVIVDCITKLLGTRIDNETRIKIRKMIAGMPEVENVSNLISQAIAALLSSVIVIVGCIVIMLIKSPILTAVCMIGINALNTGDPKTAEVVDNIIEIARKHKGVKHVHSLSLDNEEKEIAFYVVPDYAVKHRKQDLDLFYQEVCSKYPNMTIEMNLTIDM